MKKKQKLSPIPQPTDETVRRELLAALSERPHSTKELSSRIGIPEKDVWDHLEHVRRSISKSGGHLLTTPAECVKCGFVFSKRERFKKPGRCPICKSETISVPLYEIKGDRRD